MDPEHSEALIQQLAEINNSLKRIAEALDGGDNPFKNDVAESLTDITGILRENMDN